MSTTIAPARHTAAAGKHHLSACEAYEKCDASIDALLARLAALRQEHARLAATQPANWGFPGDLMGLEALLGQAIERIDLQWSGT